MSLTFKLLSLAIRTAAKPIGNYIKRQAKEHDGFRRFAVNQAQRVHRIDMRMRLGILHDPEAQQRMHEREQKAAEQKKLKAETPTVRTAEEQRQYDEQKAKEAADADKKEVQPPKVKIRPLSEARAIELGANFFSETFIFAVAAGLLIWDSWRSRKKESARRDDVAERLLELETEVESLRSKLDPDLETLHDLSERIKEAKKRKQEASWWNPLSWRRTSEDAAIMEENHDVARVEKAEEEKVEPIRKAKAIAETNQTTSSANTVAKEEPGLKPEQKKVEAKTEEKPSIRVDSVPASRKER